MKLTNEFILFLDLSYLKAVEKVPNDMPIEVFLYI
jgi:hypothetical protein